MKVYNIKLQYVSVYVIGKGILIKLNNNYKIENKYY